MADNTQLPGTGDIIADKDIGGVKYQKMMVTDENGNITHPSDLLELLKQIFQLIAWPTYSDRSLGKIRADVQGGNVTVGSCTLAANQDIRNITGALATLTNMSQIDTYQGKLPVVGINTIAWSQAARSLIT